MLVRQKPLRAPHGNKSPCPTSDYGGMSRLRRLRLGLRLAVAFAFLVAALGITVLVGVSNLKALDVSAASSPQGQDLAAQRTASELAESIVSGAHNLVRHLYVYDGDLETQ